MSQKSTSRPHASVPSPLAGAEMAAWRGFMRTHRSVTVTMATELETQFQLDLSEYEVLLHLYERKDGRIAMIELADLVLLTPSGVTRLVDRLLKRGFVERQPCPTDARRHHAVLTRAGRAMFIRAGRVHLSGIRELFLSRLTDEEQLLLAGIWKRLS